MAELELFVTQNCWVCSSCGQKFDALWRPADKPFTPSRYYMWTSDRPTFNFCPHCGEKLEHSKR